ncbi:MAG: hypothetical protein JST05_00570 [Acidobacteria bacterium]|nr:hypothetical protein [Acidobacteriota bacterium]
MRRAPLVAAILSACLTLSAQSSLKRATLDIQATFTESPRGDGHWSKTKTFTSHVPCAFSISPAAALASISTGVQSTPPGIIAFYVFTPDKTQEGEATGTLHATEVDSGATTELTQATLTGPYNGTFGLTQGIHADDLVPAAACVLLGFFKGTKTEAGRSQEWRQAAGVLLVHPDLMNPMDPEVPRPAFSMKAFQAKLAAGLPFSMTTQKTYELDYKDSHYKGNYTLTISLAP